MNHLIADNTTGTLSQYLREQLRIRYSEREANNIVAELFACYSAVKSAALVANKSQRLSESEILKYHFALKRLMAGEPLQYITGVAHFYAMQLEVNNQVLIPRPETEELVKLIVDNHRGTAPHMLDIGTGSGCIAIALKKNMPEAQIMAIDISNAALEVARRNAQAQHVEIIFEQVDILGDSPLSASYDVVVSNPPYVLRSDAVVMDEHVLNHEPHLALFVSDNDPLIYYKKIIDLSQTQLNKGGKVYCEMHEDLENAMRELFDNCNIQQFQFHKDMQYKTRIVEFQIAS
ncbi:MAG: peptide chain release factor N(5)-glutamine methyltransferase [Flavobacteriales bacterium]